MEKLLIFPFNGNGLEALDCLGSNWEFIGFVDDNEKKLGENEFGFKVFSREVFDQYSEAKVLAVPGSPATFKNRIDIIKGLNIPSSRFATVIHPRATVSPFARIGVNVLIMAGVVLTSNVIINDHVCILPNSVIHHDSFIGEYTLVGSNVTVAGYTKIGTNCYLGSGTSIINNIEVGDKTLIGMGSNVIKSIESNSKIVGNPARKI